MKKRRKVEEQTSHNNNNYSNNNDNNLNDTNHEETSTTVIIMEKYPLEIKSSSKLLKSRSYLVSSLVLILQVLNVMTIAKASTASSLLSAWSDGHDQRLGGSELSISDELGQLLRQDNEELSRTIGLNLIDQPRTIQVAINEVPLLSGEVPKTIAENNSSIAITTSQHTVPNNSSNNLQQQQQQQDKNQDRRAQDELLEHLSLLAAPNINEVPAFGDHPEPSELEHQLVANNINNTPTNLTLTSNNNNDINANPGIHATSEETTSMYNTTSALITRQNGTSELFNVSSNANK